MLEMALLFATFAFAASLTEQQKIDALIHSIEVLPSAQFIRNGSAYDGKAAAEHLTFSKQALATITQCLVPKRSRQKPSRLSLRALYVPGNASVAKIPRQILSGWARSHGESQRSLSRTRLAFAKRFPRSGGDRETHCR